MNRDWRKLVVAIAAWICAAGGASAQELEPRSYTNTPVGMNFFLAGYVYSDGKIAFDPSLAVADATFRANTEVLAYVHAFDFFGKSAKFDVIVPYTSFSAQGTVNGISRLREMSGVGDPRFRVSVNLFGAPALTLKEFANYHQDLIIGASLQVSAPLGQYDNTKLLNLGNNRWSARAELGISKAVGPWTFELAPSVMYFTDNNDFMLGHNFAQAPIYAVQGHVLYGFKSGVWISLDGVYFTGARTTINGIASDNMQANTRLGATLALPIDRHQSIKLFGSVNTSTRTGSELNMVGVAWQYRWAEGY